MKTIESLIFLLVLTMGSTICPRLGSAASTSTISSTDRLRRYPSPSGRFDVVFEPLPKNWTHVQKARPGITRESTELYAVTLYPAQSNQPVNVMYFADEGTPPLPDQIMQSLLWSPT